MALNNIDNQIVEILEKIEKEARRANKLYEDKANAIERMAEGTSISVSQMNVAADIITESKKILDELYTTYESLGRLIDSQCKPLADQGASASTIKKVYALIAYMNSESSSLKGNFLPRLIILHWATLVDFVTSQVWKLKQ